MTKLREHWDETNSKVMQRKTQLDAMLGDSQRFEAKRSEVEVWLSRMETRLERMRAVGHTADVLEAQLREQKVRRKPSAIVAAEWPIPSQISPGASTFISGAAGQAGTGVSQSISDCAIASDSACRLAPNISDVAASRIYSSG